MRVEGVQSLGGQAGSIGVRGDVTGGLWIMISLGRSGVWVI